MIKLTLKVRFENGETVEAVAGPRTQVAFEREHDTSMLDVLTLEYGEDANGKRVVTDVKFMSNHIYWLAWHALRSDLSFDEWLEGVDEIDFDLEDPGPTRPAQPATS